MYRSLRAGEVTVAGHGGEAIDAYYATPEGDGPFPGVVVIHHMPGWDEATMEITRKFAHHGYAAICPHLYSREMGPEMDVQSVATTVRESGGVPDDRLLGDVEGAAAYLRGEVTSNGKVGVIGYCSGGRQSFLAACSLELDAAVDCYGPCVLNEPPPEMPIPMVPLGDRIEELGCPVLGLFGSDDQFPPPEEVTALRARLDADGKDVTFHSYEGAGHAFFSVDRPSYRVEAANDGWARIFEFFGRHLFP